PPGAPRPAGTPPAACYPARRVAPRALASRARGDHLDRRHAVHRAGPGSDHAAAGGPVAADATRPRHRSALPDGRLDRARRAAGHRPPEPVDASVPARLPAVSLEARPRGPGPDPERLPRLRPGAPRRRAGGPPPGAPAGLVDRPPQRGGGPGHRRARPVAPQIDKSLPGASALL